MLFHTKVIVLLVAQSAALLVSGFVAPSPFGLSTPKSFSNAGPLLVSAVQDEAAETVVGDVEPDMETPKVSEPTAFAEISPPQKQRLTIFVGNLPFRKLTCAFHTFCLLQTQNVSI